MAYRHTPKVRQQVAKEVFGELGSRRTTTMRGETRAMSNTAWQNVRVNVKHPNKVDIFASGMGKTYKFRATKGSDGSITTTKGREVSSENLGRTIKLHRPGPGGRTIVRAYRNGSKASMGRSGG